MINGKKIAETRRVRKMSQSQLAEKAGTSQTHISNIERGEDAPSLKLLEKISDALGVPPRFFMNDSDMGIINSSQLVMVPLISPEVRLSAGNGNGYIDVIWDEIEKYPVFDGQLAALYSSNGLLSMYVEGDSMEPQIHDGDVVVFNHDINWVSGNIYVVCLDGRLLVKGLIYDGDNKPPILRSSNKEYDDIIVREEQFFMIYGRVLKIDTARKPKPII